MMIMLVNSYYDLPNSPIFPVYNILLFEVLLVKFFKLVKHIFRLQWSMVSLFLFFQVGLNLFEHLAKKFSE